MTKKCFYSEGIRFAEAIVSHPNQVLSKEHLFEKIWGFDSSGDISTVTVHIQKLKRKLEEKPSRSSVPRNGLGSRVPV